MMITVKVTVLQRKTLRGIREITDRDNAHSARVFTLSAIIVLSTVATKVASAPKASGPVCNKTPNSAAIVLITIAITAVTSPVSSIVLAISSPMVNIRRVSPVQSSRAISVAVTSSVAVISSVVAAISSVVAAISSVVVAISSVAVTSSAAAVTSSVVAVTSRVAAISSVDTIRMLLATTPMPNIV